MQQWKNNSPIKTHSPHTSHLMKMVQLCPLHPLVLGTQFYTPNVYATMEKKNPPIITHSPHIFVHENGIALPMTHISMGNTNINTKSICHHGKKNQPIKTHSPHTSVHENCTALPMTPISIGNTDINTKGVCHNGKEEHTNHNSFPSHLCA
jgi:hypothetical protein